MVKIFGMRFGKKRSGAEIGKKGPGIVKDAPDEEQAEAGPETEGTNKGSEITAWKEAEDILAEAGKEVEVQDGREEPVQLQEEGASRLSGATPEGIPEQPLKESPATAATASALPEQDSQDPYTGEVELVLAGPVDPKMVAKLYNYLQTTPEIKLARTSGSWERGATITVALDKPIPLISVLSSRIPEAQVTPVRPDEDAFVGGKRGVRRIKLAPKE